MPWHDRGELYPEVTGSALLDIAQRTLTEGVVPNLPPEHRYLVLMIASAVRMVAREIEQKSALEVGRRELDRLSNRTPEVDRNQARDQALVADIRRGYLDADPRAHALLWAAAAVRASIAKPSMLSRQERQLAGLVDAEAVGVPPAES